MCFNPNLQDIQGCTATPIDQLFLPSGRRRRSSPEKSNIVVGSEDRAKREELMEQFIRDVRKKKEQVTKNTPSETVPHMRIYSMLLQFMHLM